MIHKTKGPYSDCGIYLSGLHRSSEKNSEVTCRSCKLLILNESPKLNNYNRVPIKREPFAKSEK